MSTWKEKRTFLGSNAIEHKVGGQTIKFYSISVGLIFKLRAIVEPVSKAIAVLFAKRDMDCGIVQRTINPDKDGANGGMETINEAVSVAVVELRTKQQANAIEELIDALMEAKNMASLGELLLDSMRDDFPKGHEDTPAALEFIQGVPLPILTEMVMGVAQANKEVFGPLAGKLQGVLESAVAKVKAKADTKASAASTKVVPPQVG